MTATPDTAVLVVGGGPAGLAAAAELSLHGTGCVVLEPRAAVSHIAWRAADPAGLDIETAVGLRPVRAGISGV